MCAKEKSFLSSAKNKIKELKIDECYNKIAEERRRKKLKALNNRKKLDIGQEFSCVFCRVYNLLRTLPTMLGFQLLAILCSRNSKHLILLADIAQLYNICSTFYWKFLQYNHKKQKKKLKI